MAEIGRILSARGAAFVAAIALAALVAGCAGLDRNGVADWRQAKAEPLRVGENTVEINIASPSYAFETGQSFYRVLELPAEPRPFRMRVASVYTKNDRGFFHPEILVLDRNRNVLRRIEAPLKGREPVQIPPFRYILPGDLVITEPQAAFLLVRTNTELLKQDVLARGALFIPESGPVASIPPTWNIPASPVGTLWMDAVLANR